MLPAWSKCVRTSFGIQHHHTVAVPFTYNGLLAVGVSPIMADEPAEMADMAAIFINIGTLE
ncbi:hypothetical protein C7N83_06985 [Neisseria iguanae]|uniref:hydroxyethylthiazole kinase n=1 Tax=Neisseria iguanae TaxID=90242 RepID=A0A2P7U005_9NEIS|nr:hypothetical protein C7N83_06985 [Neisseria iguanae]